MSNKKKETVKKGIITSGDTVDVHYKGTLNDGSVFDSSYQRGEPINFTLGSGAMIEGFETNIAGMTLGEKKIFTIEADQAYGAINEEAVQTVPREHFPDDFQFDPGTVVTGSSPDGGVVNATIVSEGTTGVVLDFNHPMAGKALTFEVEIVNVGKPVQGLVEED